MWQQWAGSDASLLRAQTGEPDLVAAVTKLAEALLDDVGFDGPPFAPEVLASFRGVRAVHRVPMAGAGRLLPEDGELVIEVNADHSPGKQNFTVDHEVVHTLMPSYRGQRIEDAETGTFVANREEELLCDIGAAALLLDPRWLRPLALEGGPSIRTLLDLAALFAASLGATARQLARLDVWPCAFVVWEEGFRKKEHVPAGQLAMAAFEPFGVPQAKLRVDRRYVAPSFGHFVPTNKSVGDGSLVAACSEDAPLTHGVEDFDLCHRIVRLYAENYFTPYRRGDALRRRVISVLLPDANQKSEQLAPSLFQLEAF